MCFAGWLDNKEAKIKIKMLLLKFTCIYFPNIFKYISKKNFERSHFAH